MNEIEKAIRHFENMRNENIVVLNTGFGNKPNEHTVSVLWNKKDLKIFAKKDSANMVYVICLSCGGSTRLHSNNQNAIKAWNRRVDNGEHIM